MDPSIIKEMDSRTAEIKCPSCNGELEEGALRYGDAVPPVSWCRGTYAGIFKELFRKKERFKINAYRCKDCGRLELYAIQPY